MNKKVCIIGLGYIGLPTAAVLANHNYNVLGVDINQSVVNKINQGLIHIVEPDLDVIVKKSVESNFLKASVVPNYADIFIICVPTPFKEINGEPVPILDFVVKATTSIIPFIKDGNIIILESTSPVGTTHLIKKILEENNINTSNLYIAYCPERVLPGKILTELIENDRIIGGVNKLSTEVVANFYRTFVKGVVIETDDKTAEMCKLTENSYRDVCIAFANELSIICSLNKINVWELIRLANHHPRVNILQPGTGVGGHCIAVDPWLIIAQDPLNSKLIKTARNVNDYKTEWVIEQIILEAKKFKINYKKDPVIACLGLSFKPNIDDLRESPAVKVANDLLMLKYKVIVVEPNITYHNVFILNSLTEAKKEADIFVLLVSHNEFLTEIHNGYFDELNLLNFCTDLKLQNINE